MAWVWARVGDKVRDYNHRFVVERHELSGSVTRVAVPGITRPGSAYGGRAWTVSVPQWPQPAGTPERFLLRLTAGSDGEIEVATITGWPDITPLLPHPQPPAGMDPQSWAEAKRAELEAVFAGGWQDDETGEIVPFLDGATVESVSLEGSFPATECVIRFRVDASPGIEFGRRFRCFDETGSPIWEDFTALYLMEDVQGGAVLPVPQELADSGIIWI